MKALVGSIRSLWKDMSFRFLLDSAPLGSVLLLAGILLFTSQLCASRSLQQKAKPRVICFAHAVFDAETGVQLLDPRTGKPLKCHDPAWHGEGM